MDAVLEDFLVKVASWARSKEDISEVLLVGSHAMGSGSAESDVDLVMLCSEPNRYLKETGWARQFGQIERQEVEDWGKLRSLRVWYADGFEVEFGFANPDWLTKPIDPGTRKVLADGNKIIFDRNGRLATLKLEGSK